ncbi:MAG: ethanolamine permease [Myxococcales bacterium]|nr:ethanolamine permease [Myxococcales bacterium]
MQEDAPKPQELRRRLGALHLWSIAVGMVISGQYFGWTYGFGVAGPLGMLAAAAIVTVFYTAFVFSYAELAAAIPAADGPSAYCRRAMSPFFGFLAGFAVLLELGFAPPAIAVATGSYIQFLMPAIPADTATVAVFLIFIGVNLFAIEGAALVELIATGLALVGLALYYGAGLPHVDLAALSAGEAWLGGASGVAAAIPFAIWLYLGVEGAAMAAEEVRDPPRDIPRGFIAGILTLATCSVGTVLVTAGLGGGEGAPADYPLPPALASAYGAEHWLTRAVALIGLTGLVASLHGILMGLSRQTFALARAGYLPRFLARISTRGIPHWAVLVPGLFGVLCAGSAALSNALILLSVFGSVVMTCMSVVALLVLRRREPELARPYRVPSLAIPWSALVLGLGALYCVVTYALEGAELPWMGVTLPLPWVLMGLLAGAVGYYALVGRRGARAADGGG